MYIIFLGAPGAGKGTQAASVAQELNLAYIAPGDLFRRAVQQRKALGMQAKSYMEKGVLVPDEMTIQMVLERMSAPDGEHGVILDGFPRNISQELLRRLSGRWICRDCQTPYHTMDSPPKIWGKCDKCGGELYQRPDDTVETAKKRLQIYLAQTAPLVDYYARVDKLLAVDGEGSVDEVRQRIVAVLRGEFAHPRQR